MSSPAAIPTFGFDRSKPFYPLVMNYNAYLVGQHLVLERGTQEVFGPTYRSTVEALRQARERTASDPASTQEVERLVTELTDLLKTFPSLGASLAAAPANILPEMVLRCSAPMPNIELPRADICREFLENHNYLMSTVAYNAGLMLTQAFQVAERFRQGTRAHHPLWQFLRHCRNAAAHNGRFDIREEIAHPAVWGPFALDRDTHHGMPLMDPPPGTGLLAIGDPIRLLSDIEQAFPDMTV